MTNPWLDALPAENPVVGRGRIKKYTDDGMRNTYGPIARLMQSCQPEIINGTRGIMRSLDADAVMFAYSWAYQTENCLMNIIDELKTQYAEAAELWKSYEKQLQQFRATVKNDITSLEAGARKTTESVTRMNKAYGDVITQMNGEEMQQAIQNAERLAAAMTALANLQSHKLTFSVIDNDRGSQA